MSDDRGERERFEDWFRSVRPPHDTAVALRWLRLSRSHGFAGSWGFGSLPRTSCHHATCTGSEPSRGTSA